MPAPSAAATAQNSTMRPPRATSIPLSGFRPFSCGTGNFFLSALVSKCNRTSRVHKFLSVYFSWVGGGGLEIDNLLHCDVAVTDWAATPCEYGADRQPGFGRGIEMTPRNWILLITPLAVALGAPARGADLPVKAPPTKAPVAAPYSWTGWYI